MKKIICSTLLTLLVFTSCSDTGRQYVNVAFYARGTEATHSVIQDWTITLTRVDVSLGPIYFCATSLASYDLCETALIENRQTHVIDGLDSSEQSLGTLEGVSGTVRSTLYDFGWSFFINQNAAAPTEGAIEDHSAIIEGTATQNTSSFDFIIYVDVIPDLPGDTAVHGQQTEHEIDGDGHQLTVEIDPYIWLEHIDFDELATLAEESDMPLIIERGVTAHDAVVLQMTANHRPDFDWN